MNMFPYTTKSFARSTFFDPAKRILKIVFTGLIMLAWAVWGLCILDLILLGHFRPLVVIIPVLWIVKIALKKRRKQIPEFIM
jgi:hypothetical protein